MTTSNSTKQISIAKLPNSGLVVFVRTPSGDIRYVQQEGAYGNWLPWYNLGSHSDRITTGKLPPGGFELFATGTDNVVRHIWQDKAYGNWSGWEDLGGISARDAIAVGVLLNGGFEVFTVGTDHRVYHRWQDKWFGNWSGWESLGGTATSLAVGQLSTGGFEVFATGTDNVVRHIWQDKAYGNWSGWEDLGGISARDAIAVGVLLNGGFEVFTVGTDHRVYHRWQDKWFGNWSGWESLGGTATSLAVGQLSTGGFEVFATGTDNVVRHIWQDKAYGNWSGWEDLGGISVANDIQVEELRDGGFEVFAFGADLRVYHIWQNRWFGDWSHWENVTPPPVITSFSPDKGTSGTTVTIQGSSFEDVISVKIGPAAASFHCDSDTRITAVVPNGATSNPISVTTRTGTATSRNTFVVRYPPTITGFVPSQGWSGTSVRIMGTYLSDVNSVKFNNLTASFRAASDSELNAVVPKGATSGPLSVSNPLGSASTGIAIADLICLKKTSTGTGKLEVHVLKTGRTTSSRFSSRQGRRSPRPTRLQTSSLPRATSTATASPTSSA